MQNSSSVCTSYVRQQTGQVTFKLHLPSLLPTRRLPPLDTHKKNQLKFSSCLTLFKVSLGLQYSVFHGSNSLYHHSSLPRQKGNRSRGVHGHKQILQDEEADVDSSAHTSALNNEDAKKPWFLQIINNKIKSLNSYIQTYSKLYVILTQFLLM